MVRVRVLERERGHGRIGRKEEKDEQRRIRTDEGRVPTAMERGGTRGAAGDAHMARGTPQGHAAANRGRSRYTDGTHARRVGGRSSDEQRRGRGRKPSSRAASMLSDVWRRATR